MGFDPEDEALKRILGDMDGMESNRMFGGDSSKGVSITISVVPNGEGGGDGDADDFPPGHDASMCKGGCAMHSGGLAMNAGGLITDPGIMNNEKDLAGNKPHKFSEGGEVEGDSVNKESEPPSKGKEEGSPEEDESKLPPFLRKKKKPLQDA